jgi:protein-S-isoprenylcysteine O-methyltransferase Ste14
VNAALHSLLLTDTARAVFRRLLGPTADRWHRLAYNAVAVALLVSLEQLLARLPDRTLYTLPDPYRSLVRVGRVAASAGLAYCLWLTDAATFLGLRQAGLALARARPLVDWGPYGRIRHPSYW